MCTSTSNLATPCPTNRVWKFRSPRVVAEHGLDLALRLVSNPHPSRNVLFVALTQNSAAISTENTDQKNLDPDIYWEQKILPLLGELAAPTSLYSAKELVGGGNPKPRSRCSTRPNGREVNSLIPPSQPSDPTPLPFDPNFQQTY